MATTLTARAKEGYRAALWGLMDAIGVNESIERKVVAAVTLQFLAAVAQVVLPFLVSGLLWYVLTAAVFVAAAVAFLNTLLIVREDFVGPIKMLESETTEIAAGNVDVDIERADQPDEIGGLTESFAEMGAYLQTVSDQAAALARQDFDDPALDETVPGEFGESLGRMA